METRQPILSICIPTYNRSTFLREALENITKNVAFNNQEIEIVISDNASTDDTEIVANEFCQQYPNIKYFKNKENIRDKNFYLSLSRARGKYVRLFNDTLRFNDEALSFMLSVIKQAKESTPLFFFNNIKEIGRVSKSMSVNNTSSFINAATYYITWIANFGCWRSCVDRIKDPNQYSKLQLTQVDWFLQIVESNEESHIYFADVFISIPPEKKGGYNFYEVFVDNYLYLLRKYKIDCLKYEIEKYRLLKFCVLTWRWLMLNDTEGRYSFDTTGASKILLRHYGLHVYFYYKIFVQQIKYYIKRLIKG